MVLSTWYKEKRTADYEKNSYQGFRICHFWLDFNFLCIRWSIYIVQVCNLKLMRFRGSIFKYGVLYYGNILYYCRLLWFYINIWMYKSQLKVYFISVVIMNISKKEEWEINSRQWSARLMFPKICGSLLLLSSWSFVAVVLSGCVFSDGKCEGKKPNNNHIFFFASCLIIADDWINPCKNYKKPKQTLFINILPVFPFFFIN